MPDAMPEKFPPTDSRIRLTKDQRAEILRRVATGERQTVIAKDYGVSRAAISLIKVTAEDPERFAKHRVLKKQLTAEEVTTFKNTLKKSQPGDHGIIIPGSGPLEIWTLPRARALAQKLFGKDPSVRALKECMPPPGDRRRDQGLRPPKPPGPRDVRFLPPDLAADEDFVKYYLSPIALQLEQREYELALAHYQQRLEAQKLGRTVADDDEDSATEEPSPPASGLVAAPGQRVGKHAKSKGNPSTKPKPRGNKR